MTNYLPLLPEILASIITAGITVMIAFWKFKSSAKLEFTQAELSDRLDFRRTLMARVTYLEGEIKLAQDASNLAQAELAECHVQHADANRRIGRLEAALSSAGIDLKDDRKILR